MMRRLLPDAVLPRRRQACQDDGVGAVGRSEWRACWARRVRVQQLVRPMAKAAQTLVHWASHVMGTIRPISTERAFPFPRTVFGPLL